MLSILPDDVICEIFKKLPVKSLLLLKQLDETWCQIIESPMFIKSHFEHQQSVKRENEKICIVSIDSGGTLVMIDACGYGSKGCTTETIAQLRTPKSAGTCYYLGSIDGLICICVEEYSSYTSIEERIIIWNLSTGKSNIIKAPAIYNPFAERNYLAAFNWSACVYGFCHVSSIDDYRVVRICYYQFGVHPHVEVFSVKTNRWSEISMDGLAIPNDFPLKDYRDEQVTRAVVINEIMYYKTIEYANDGMELCKIRCFDLESGCFLEKLVSLPPGLEHYHSKDLKLAELGGDLCCTSCKELGYYEIWKKERGEGDVWSKMISVPFWEWPSRAFIPICLTSQTRFMVNNVGRGEYLIVTDGKDLYELDMSTGKIGFFYKLQLHEYRFRYDLKGCYEEKLFLFDQETLISPN